MDITNYPTSGAEIAQRTASGRIAYLRPVDETRPSRRGLNPFRLHNALRELPIGQVAHMCQTTEDEVAEWINRYAYHHGTEPNLTQVGIIAALAETTIDWFYSMLPEHLEALDEPEIDPNATYTHTWDDLADPQGTHCDETASLATVHLIGHGLTPTVAQPELDLAT